MIELKKLGVEPVKMFNPTKLDSAILKGINQALSEVRKQFGDQPHNAKIVNGWRNILDLDPCGKDYHSWASIAFAVLGALPKEGLALSKHIPYQNRVRVCASKAGLWSILPIAITSRRTTNCNYKLPPERRCTSNIVEEFEHCPLGRAR